MRKFALVFVCGVIAPSLVLAWLAVRSLKDEQLAAERQQTLLYEGVADALAREVNGALEGIRREFHDQVEAILRKREPAEVAPEFDVALRRTWPLAEVGFAVALDKQVIAPSPFAGPTARQFRLENERFLSSRESLVVYWNGPKGAINLTEFDKKDFKAKSEIGDGAAEQRKDKDDGQASLSKAPKAYRLVPAEKSAEADAGSSRAAHGEADFRQIVADANEGVFARFLQDRLKVFFWYRSPDDTNLVFGAQVNVGRLGERLREAVRIDPSLGNEIGAALLNDLGQPVACSPNGLRAEWSHPFAAREVSDALPHWQAAVYLTNLARLGQTARMVRLVLGLIIGTMVLAIAVGSWLIASDLKRQLTLARQKTDFVSNVSHELKTPLTSIRMFSEMLAQGQEIDETKRVRFLNIITAETARLTRLINNVLDFGQLERGEKRYQFSAIDLAEVVRETVESYRPHLENLGFRLELELPDGPMPVHGDRDALAQALLTLLSNAEKYAGERKEIRVRSVVNGSWLEVSVLDRGIGVPPGFEEKIFEQFFRAHDSLANAAQGSGLGLTLARGFALAHHGEVLFRRREGGGSCFVLRLPRAGSVVAANMEVTNSG
jgi:signal transduction histidine kinase